VTQSPAPHTLTGERLRLVPLGPEHLDAVRRWRSDPEVTRYWITQEVPNEATIRAWYERNRADGALVWAILHQGQPVGYVTLFDIDPLNRKAELALMIGERAAWGQGFAGDTLRTLLRHALSAESLDGLGLNKVYLSVFAENVAARRAYARSGFHEDGILREDMLRDGVWHDQILMSVLARELDGVPSHAAR
jgi:RimJ/RimL family protein N-acetyltransferase